MLGQGFEAGCRYLGIETRCLCHVEGEIYAAGVLAARMQEGSISKAPMYSDVRSFDGSELSGYVDALVGGFPCQDLSVAGKREGIGGDKSGLWEQFRRLIREIQPGIVYIENVPGLATSLTLLHCGEIMGHIAEILRAAEVAETPRERWYIERHHDRLYRRLLKIHGIPALLYVQACLGEMGYESETGFFSAAEVGPPHKRERVFVLAYRKGGRLRELRQPSRSDGQSDGCGGDVADGISNRRNPRGPARTLRSEHESRDGSKDGGEHMADSSNGLLQKQGRGQEGRTGFGSASAATGDTGQQRLEGRSSQPGNNGTQRAATERAGDDLPSPNGQHDDDTGHGTGPICRERSEPSQILYPPGPSDRDAWSRMPAHLAPAIEPGLRYELDDDAVVVDQSRTDQLRAGGNGVVALTAGFAFVALARRAGIF